MRKRIKGKIKRAMRKKIDKIYPRDKGTTKQLSHDRMLLDEIFGLIEYHARIIANWRTKASSGYENLLLEQAERIVALLKLLPKGVAESTMGGHDQ